MSNEQVEISLVGAKTYGTLKRVYQAGEPTTVSLAVWESLREERNPADGAVLFCLTSELPPAPVSVSRDLSTADLTSVGLGEIDTGSQSVVNTLAVLNEQGADSEDFPAGASEGLPPGEVTLEQALSLPDSPEPTPTPVPEPEAAPTADTAVPAGAKKVTLGGKGKTVTV